MASNGAPDPRPGWRGRVDAWGGLPVVASLAVLVVVLGALIYLNLPEGDAAYEPVERAQVSGKRWGDAAAPVRIVEFADFRCPHCRDFALETEPLLAEEYIETGQVRVEFRQFPVLGEESMRAAEASECANEQGYFWPMHDLLFARGDRLGAFSAAGLREIARELAEHEPGFDVEAFEGCLASGRMAPTVTAQSDEALELGFRSTPTFLVGDTVVSGNQPIDVFRDAIDAALERAARSDGAGGGRGEAG